MIKDHYLVGRREQSDVRQVRVHLWLHVGLRKLTPTYSLLSPLRGYRNYISAPAGAESL